MSKPDHPCPICGNRYASVCGCDMNLPAGERCETCAHWLRCRAFGFSTNPDAIKCDFAPSRFVATMRVESSRKVR